MIKTFINEQENGVITFKGNTEPCAVYVNGERQDNISYIPQPVEGVNSVEYSSEYKKNIRTMRIDGNTEQYQGTFAPQNITIPTSYVTPSSAPIIVSATPITVPNGARLTLTVTKTGNGNVSSLPDNGGTRGFIVIISDSQDDIANNYTEVLEDYGTPQYLATPKVSGQFYIGIANFLPGGIDNPQAYWDFLRANYTFTLSTEGNTVPNPDFPQPIHNANDTRLPSEYQEVEYIESTGTQYIDTGVFASENNSFEVKAQLVHTDTASQTVWGGRQSGTLGSNQLSYVKGGGLYQFACGNVAQSSKVWDTDLHIFKSKKNILYVDGEWFYSAQSAQITTQNNVYLFATNTAGTVGFNGGDLKIYYCKIWNNDTLIRDLIPCYRISDNKVGMYDLANGVFYTNKGTGEFVKGANVEMSLELRGKNLFDIDNYLSKTFTGVKCIGFDISNLKIGTMYRFTSNLPLTWVKISTAPVGHNSVQYHKDSGFKSFTFTMARNSNISETATQYMFLGVSGTNTITDISQINGFNIQIEQGSTATPYEPYFAPTTITIPPSVTVEGTEIHLRFAKYKNADYLLVDRTNGTVKYYQYSTEGDPTKPLSEQLENIPPLEYTLYDKATNITTDLGQALFELPTENQTNIITITSTPSVSKLSVNYAKYGGVI